MLYGITTTGFEHVQSGSGLFSPLVIEEARTRKQLPVRVLIPADLEQNKIQSNHGRSE